jgi:DNA-binding transcriptional regulator YdaS (Cro superfamily)
MGDIVFIDRNIDGFTARIPGLKKKFAKLLGLSENIDIQEAKSSTKVAGLFYDMSKSR